MLLGQRTDCLLGVTLFLTSAWQLVAACPALGAWVRATFGPVQRDSVRKQPEASGMLQTFRRLTGY